MQPYSPHLTLHTATLKEQEKKTQAFYWDDNTNTSFQKQTKLFSKAHGTLMQYYWKDLSICNQADASKYGLGTYILQHRKLITFTSKSLMDTETHYVNITQELLAVIFVCKCFHIYLYGHPFRIETDHKPLEMMAWNTCNCWTPSFVENAPLSSTIQFHGQV